MMSPAYNVLIIILFLLDGAHVTLNIWAWAIPEKIVPSQCNFINKRIGHHQN